MLCAIVAVARKLAGILHRTWIDGSDFKVGFGTKVTQSAGRNASRGEIGAGTRPPEPLRVWPPERAQFTASPYGGRYIAGETVWAAIS